MLVLGFDTATPAVSVALHDGERVIAAASALDGRRHSELLMPMIAKIMADAGASRADLTAIAVGVGPGPYTGLRVGVVTARVLGSVLRLPVSGVCSLDVIAASASPAGPFLVATDARRKEVYWARYDAGGRRVDGPHVGQASAIPDAVGLPVAGAGGPLYPEAFGELIAPAYPDAGTLCGLVAQPVAQPRPGRAARPGAAVPAPPRRPRARAAQAGHPVMKPKQEQAREVRLREMRRADMPRIMALERELFPEDAWTPEMFASEFAQPASRRLYLVAEEGKTLIGYAGMMFTGGPQADVVTLAVDPGRWSRGTGTALLTALTDEAARRGCTEVLLEVREDNPRARRLYLREGFTEIGIRRGYYQPSGVDAVVMRKALT